jgi:predicted YcjX-like family ATPase
MQLTSFQKDVLERVVRTFIQAAIGVFALELANPDVSLDSLQAAGAAAVAAGVSAIMALIGKTVGDPDSGSWREE